MKRLLLLLLSIVTLQAHDVPGSAVALDFHPDSVSAELTLPLQELELSFKQPLLDNPASVIERYKPQLQSYIAEHIQPMAPDGRPWAVEVAEMKLQLGSAPFDLIAEVRMTPPPGASPRKFCFNYSIINHEVMTHRAMVFVRNDWDTAVFSGHPETLGMLQFVVTGMDIDRSRGSWTQGFRSVFRHGIQHISEGTDHLLFLLVLLLPAPLLAAGKRWSDPVGVKTTVMRLLKIVSAFTLGHSLTLALAGLGWLRLPSQPVEVMIAVSILVSAVHAIRPWFAGKEAWIAIGFGLIHGLAFASTLESQGFSTWHLALNILAFNLGIEAMQLFVVLCLAPWLVLLSRTKAYAVIRIGGAIFAGVAALGWIAERGLGWPNPIEHAVTALAAHGWWIVAILAAATLLALLMNKSKQAAVIP
ncbi:HupE/UreJ family protein [Luteolibacter soli]|uniref:HupE/UreJ family protein n=1 Tax=Luteolibacter soli TaxID=3135280 RepID=A0ABU9B4R2_9BACT